MAKEAYQFPDLTLMDQARHCSIFTTILNRGNEECSADDVDGLQQNLEQMLVDATKTQKLVTATITLLEDSSKAGKDRKRDHDLKRSRASEDRHNKKSKPSENLTLSKISGGGTGSSARNKIKNSGKLDTERTEVDSSTCETPYDTPKKFWDSIAPYCCPITPKIISYLEQMSKLPEGWDELMKIPELGQFYIDRWAEEDGLQNKNPAAAAAQQSEMRRILSGGRLTDSPPPFGKNTTGTSDGGGEEEDMGSGAGSLYNRLQGILMEERNPTQSSSPALLQPSRQEKTSANEAMNKSSKNLPLLKHSEDILMNVLVSQGILESDADKGSSRHVEDEIETDLREAQAELATINQEKQAYFVQLLAAAKKEAKKEEINKELKELTTEIKGHYSRQQLLKSKKKNLSKKEKEVIYKALKKQDALYEELLALSSSN